MFTFLKLVKMSTKLNLVTDRCHTQTHKIKLTKSSRILSNWMRVIIVTLPILCYLYEFLCIQTENTLVYKSNKFQCFIRIRTVRLPPLAFIQFIYVPFSLKQYKFQHEVLPLRNFTSFLLIWRTICCNFLLQFMRQHNFNTNITFT